MTDLCPITEAEARAAVEQLLPRLAAARAAAADAERRIAGLRMAIEGLALAYPELAACPEVAEVLRTPEASPSKARRPHRPIPRGRMES